MSKDDVSEFVFSDNGERAYAPHCDPKVLHAPGVCDFCDHYDDWQALRFLWDMAFTGEEQGNKVPDPAAFFRKDAGQSWPGNRPEGYANSGMFWIPESLEYDMSPLKKKSLWKRFMDHVNGKRT